MSIQNPRPEVVIRPELPGSQALRLSGSRALKTIIMLPKDIFKKIRRIEITTNRLVTDVFAGQYHSVFKGRGMEFDEVREYQIGDDIRNIDWNVTARTGTAHIKKYIEERELTVMILVDCSMSMRFATENKLKSRLAAEIAAVLAFSAIRNHDKVGALFFTDKIEKFIPPRKGPRNVLRLIREILCFEPQGCSTDIARAVEHLSKVTTRRAVVFLISDFFESTDGDDPLYQKALGIASRRHDLTAVSVTDPAETGFKNIPGLLMLEDAETGRRVCIDPGDKEFARSYARGSDHRARRRGRLFRSLGMDEISVSTDGSYVDEIVKFFMTRRRRR